MPLEKIQTGSVRRKIIFVFLTFAVALAMSLLISRTAFREMMMRVDKITLPDRKLQLVHQVNQAIIPFAMAHSIDDDYIEANQRIDHLLDSLKVLYDSDQQQLTRIDSIRHLIQHRESIFAAYVDVRQRIVDNRDMDFQLNSLGEILDTSETDSVIRSTEKQKVATVVRETPQEKKESRGLLSRLFGRSIRDASPEEKRVVTEKVNVQIDTITKGNIDSASAKIGEMVNQIKSDRSQQRSRFLNHESQLAQADSELINTIFEILYSVEKEALQHSKIEHQLAKQVVNQSIDRIVIVFVVVLLSVAVMIYFILADVKKNNAYRLALEAAKEDAEFHAAAKQRFLSNMSHELRTPLQSIVGYTEQMKLNQKEEDPMVDAIHQSTEHLLQIVNEILDYSRINSGKIVLETREIEVQEIAAGIVGIMQPLAHKKKLVLHHELAIDSSLKLLGDPFRVKQLLFNLLSNAIKFTDEGSVRLSVEVSKGKTESMATLNIRVEDTGVGIEPENIERIFEDFEQAEPASTQGLDGINKGSGLGLSIVRTIAKSMGGSTKVSSELGRGSIFEVYVPLKIALYTDKERRSGSELEAPTTSFNGSIWLIDDDPLILQLCEMILCKHKIPFKSFSSPHSVLSADVDDDLVTVLMDIRMPGMDGFALNQLLREKLKDRSVAIYAFTAQALPDEQSNIRSRGFDGILLKPFREKDLLRLLGVTPLKTKSHMHSENNNTNMPMESIEWVSFDDPAIRELFVKDSLSDIETLHESFHQGELEKISFTAHRLAGRVGQFGNNKIAFKLRKIEIDTRNGELPERDAFEGVLHEVNAYVAEVSEVKAV